ncbi:Hydroxysteroid dehydrogenase 1 [Hibiscus syriacus]|uniref:Hydroxysteroid dehydrogenase 1 n=1 Tax=Hibiscus syriacus TaxID=106335 RepID=A0A6A2XYK1_HIBSY|nr:uncharacterized protein LOC120187220 [Hibiscus syriacus]KAE8661717.1 Hydroxysteroid dehydrogenase 1 [Hibiscus syriacus]
MVHNLMLKFQAIKKSKKQQFLDKVLLYTFIAFTCSFFCSSPFWLPYLLSSFNNFLIVSSTKMGSIMYNPKLLFFLGNLIVAVLIGESKFFARFSGSGDVYYDEYVDHHRSPTPGNYSILEVKREMKTKHCEENVKVATSFQVEDHIREVKKEKNEPEGEHEAVLPTEELKKRADDFIARVNRHRRLEATLSV